MRSKHTGKTRSKALARKNRARSLKIIKKLKYDIIVNNKVSHKGYKDINIVPEIISELRNCCETAIDANSYSKSPNVEQSASKSKFLRANLLHRIIGWGKITVGLFKKLEQSNDFNSEKNKFEIVVKDLLEKFFQSSKIIKSKKFYLKQNVYGRSDAYGFLSGTCDIVVYDSKHKPIFVVECKQTLSPLQFSKLIKDEKINSFKLASNHEYVTQVNAYCHVFDVKYGFLFVTDEIHTYVAKVDKYFFDKDSFESMTDFYLFYLLPHQILNTMPSMRNEEYTYFTDFEKKCILKAIDNEEQEIQEFIQKRPCFRDLPNTEEIY